MAADSDAQNTKKILLLGQNMRDQAEIIAFELNLAKSKIPTEIFSRVEPSDAKWLFDQWRKDKITPDLIVFPLKYSQYFLKCMFDNEAFPDKTRLLAWAYASEFPRDGNWVLKDGRGEIPIAHFAEFLRIAGDNKHVPVTSCLRQNFNEIVGASFDLTVQKNPRLEACPF